MSKNLLLAVIVILGGLTLASAFYRYGKPNMPFDSS